jgi:hypothetical protein
MPGNPRRGVAVLQRQNVDEFRCSRGITSHAGGIPRPGYVVASA